MSTDLRNSKITTDIRADALKSNSHNNALCDLEFVTLTEKRNEKNVDRTHGFP